jgi:uncharacterized membrane protein YkvA (DUF1232 family)
MPSNRKPTSRPKTTPKKKPAAKARPQAGRYSESSFWNVVRGSFRAIGEKTLVQAITLFHTLQDKKTPSKARYTILAALAYLILPTDLIPDFLPIVGFTDDMGAIAAAMAGVTPYIKATHKRKAAKQVAELFS